MSFEIEIDADLETEDAFAPPSAKKPAPGNYHMMVEDAEQKEGSVLLKLVVLAGPESKKHAYKTIWPPSFVDKETGMPLSEDEIKERKKRVINEAYALGVITKQGYAEAKQRGERVVIDFTNSVGKQCIVNLQPRKDKPDYLNAYVSPMDDTRPPKGVIYDEELRKIWFDEHKLVYPGPGKPYVADPKAAARKAKPEMSGGVEASVF